MHDVMGVTAVRERTAPRKHTPTITACQRTPLIAGEEPLRTPKIQRDTQRVEDHRPHIEITHQREVDPVRRTPTLA